MRSIQDIIKSGIIFLKIENYLLYHNGFFGNKPLTWNSVDEIIKNEWRGGICIRGSKGIPRSKAKYNLTLKKAIKYINKLGKERILPKELTFNQSMPDEHLLIQGEIMNGVNGGLELTYSTIKKPMNLALAEEELFTKGLAAKILLKQNLSPSSYSDMMELLDIFPDSIIEFSSYDIPVGNLPNRNTVCWEVRNY